MTVRQAQEEILSYMATELLPGFLDSPEVCDLEDVHTNTYLFGIAGVGSAKPRWGEA